MAWSFISNLTRDSFLPESEEQCNSIQERSVYLFLLFHLSIHLFFNLILLARHELGFLSVIRFCERKSLSCFFTLFSFPRKVRSCDAFDFRSVLLLFHSWVRSSTRRKIYLSLSLCVNSNTFRFNEFPDYTPGDTILSFLLIPFANAFELRSPVSQSSSFDVSQVNHQLWCLWVNLWTFTSCSITSVNVFSFSHSLRVLSVSVSLLTPLPAVKFLFLVFFFDSVLTSCTHKMKLEANFMMKETKLFDVAKSRQGRTKLYFEFFAETSSSLPRICSPTLRTILPKLHDSSPRASNHSSSCRVHESLHVLRSWQSSLNLTTVQLNWTERLFCFLNLDFETKRGIH